MLRNLFRVQLIRSKAATGLTSWTIFTCKSKSALSNGKSGRKNSNNFQTHSPLTHASESDLRSYPLPSVRHYGSSSGDIGKTESVDDLISQVNSCIKRRDLNMGLIYSTIAVEKSKTADELLNSLTLKRKFSIALQKFDWDDEFLSEIKRMDLESPQFHEIWERLFGALVGSFDLYSPYCKTFFDKALKAFPNNVIVTIKHAEVLLSFQRNNEAENWLNKAIEIDANRCRPWVLLWRLNPSKVSYLKKAIECPDSEKDTLLWSEYAKKQIYEDNNVDAGIESLKKAAADRPILPGVEQVFNEISVKLMVKGDFVSAEKVVRPWIEESPKRAVAWSCLGSILNAQKRPQEAEKCFRKAIEVEPQQSAPWFNLGNMLPAKEGIPMLQHALKLNPKLDRAHYRLAMYYGELEQFALALESINKAIELNSNVSDYQLLKSELEQIESSKRIRSADLTNSGFK